MIASSSLRRKASRHRVGQARSARRIPDGAIAGSGPSRETSTPLAASSPPTASRPMKPAAAANCPNRSVSSSIASRTASGSAQWPSPSAHHPARTGCRSSSSSSQASASSWSSSPPTSGPTGSVSSASVDAACPSRHCPSLVWSAASCRSNRASIASSRRWPSPGQPRKSSSQPRRPSWSRCPPMNAMSPLAQRPASVKPDPASSSTRRQSRISSATPATPCSPTGFAWFASASARSASGPGQAGSSPACGSNISGSSIATAAASITASDPCSPSPCRTISIGVSALTGRP